MKRSRFSDERIIGILKEQEAGGLTADVCRRHGNSPATFYKWKSKFGGLEVTECARIVIDATQFAGVLDLDLRTLRPDFLVFPTYKWVCGPNSLAFLYVATEHQAGASIEHHTRAHGAEEALVATTTSVDRVALPPTARPHRRAG